MSTVPERTQRLNRLFERAAEARAQAAAIADGLPARAGSRLTALLLDEIDAAVVATDPLGCVTHWNAAAERLYGWTTEEAVGEPAERLLVPASAEWDAVEIMAAVLSEGSWEGRFDTRRKDGAVVPVHVRDFALHDDLGRVAAVVGISRVIVGASRAGARVREPGRWVD